MASVGKAFKNFFVLINFFEENKYSVEKLKDVISRGTSCGAVFQCEEFKNWTGWNSSEVVEVRWNDGNVYPGYFLQFGENKKEMEDLVDDLHARKLSTSEVPLLQVSRPFATGSRLKSKEKNDGSSAKIVSLKVKQKEKSDIVQNKILQDVREKMTGKLPCVSCKTLEQQLVDTKESLNVANEEVSRLQIKVAHYKEKADRYRRKYKEAKSNVAEETNMAQPQPSLTEMCQLGNNNTMVVKSKLSMCRTTNYSKYVGDLLDVLFTTETLGNSVIKGISGSKKSVLDIAIVSDLQQHVAEKFSVPVQNVRAAIRQKLNVSHKIIHNKEK